MKGVFLVSLLAASRLSAGQMPNLCLSSPPVQLVAGLTPVSASVFNPSGLRCIATLNFEDADFLPVSYVFKSPQCRSQELQTFQVPLEAPDGFAFVVWQCAGKSPTCSRAVISGGQANSSLELQQAGNVSCVDQIMQTSTFLATVTRGSSTIVETLRSVFTSTTTSQVLPTTTNPSIPPAVETDAITKTGNSAASAALTSSPPSATNPSPPTNPKVSSTGVTVVPSPQMPSSASILEGNAPNNGDPLGFSVTSGGSTIRPSVIATTMISTITVVQTMTALVTACVSR